MNKSKAPKYCYLRKGRWVYIPYINGKREKEISLKHDGKLIRENDPMSRVWAAFERIVGTPSDTLWWLIQKYLKSPKFNKMAHRTKRNYKASADFLKTKKLSNKTLFVEMAYEAVTSGLITKLNDTMIATPTASKHRIQFLASVYSWACARDFCTHNPCKNAEKTHKDKGEKGKYFTHVEDKAYFTALEIAKERKSYLYPIMIIAYCSRARIGEISRLEVVEGVELLTGIRLNDISKEGIYIHRSKGSLPEITLWSEFLEEGYRAAMEYSKAQDRKSNISRLMPNPFLIRDREGNPIKKNAFDSAWQRLVKKCIEIDPDWRRFSIHELKAKGVGDHKTHESGHKSEKGKMVYMRKIKRTISTK